MEKPAWKCHNWLLDGENIKEEIAHKTEAQFWHTPGPLSVFDKTGMTKPWPAHRHH